MKLVFLLEERSTKELLDILLPRVLPPDIQFITIPHEGKADLRKSLSAKLKGWTEPNVRFVIIQDQDLNDCKMLKEDIMKTCEGSKRDVLIRIACHEMEAWYFGDLSAVSLAYGRDLTSLSRNRKYRIPDAIISPKKELKKLLPEHEQISGARRIAQYMDPQRNTSKSFNVLIDGIKRIFENT